MRADSDEEGQIGPVTSGIRISVYSPLPDEAGSDLASRSFPLRTLHYGDRVRFVTKLRRPRNFRNPGAFDYEGYLADRGIAALGSTKLENVEALPGFSEAAQNAFETGGTQVSSRKCTNSGLHSKPR